jgi:lycopene cyclase domain-containing protein
LSFIYLGALLASIAGLAALDFRHKLAFASNAIRSVITLAIGVGFFLVWDISGIALGIFFRGQARHLTGWQLAPELPLEELFFLFLLCYTTLLVFLAVRKKIQ